MSKLSEKIRRAGRVETGRIGFGVAAERRVNPSLLCLLRLDKDQAKKPPSAEAADAVIITGVEPAKLSDIIGRLGDAAAGLVAADGRSESVAAARQAGADFVVLDEDSAAEALLEEQIGFVLRVDPGASDVQLRTMAGLPLDAIEVPSVQEPFSVRRLSELRRIALLTQTPLLLEVKPDATAPRLEALREAGVAGVIVDGRSAGKLADLRQTILSLPPRGRRREERAEAILPPLTAIPEGEEEEPDIE